MNSGFLQFDQSNIHYLRSGNGERVLICFHGYGESAAHFQFLTEKLKDEFTMISLDLPFHGQTNWQTGMLDEERLQSVIDQILTQENLPRRQYLFIRFQSWRSISPLTLRKNSWPSRTPGFVGARWLKIKFLVLVIHANYHWQ